MGESEFFVKVSGGHVSIGSRSVFKATELRKLRNQADAKGVSLERYIEDWTFVCQPVGDLWNPGGALENMRSIAAYEGLELADLLMSMIFMDWETNWPPIRSRAAFLRRVSELYSPRSGDADGEGEITDKDHGVVMSIARECLAGRGKKARALAAELAAKGWEINGITGAR